MSEEFSEEQSAESAVSEFDSASRAQDPRLIEPVRVPSIPVPPIPPRKSVPIKLPPAPVSKAPKAPDSMVTSMPPIPPQVAVPPESAEYSENAMAPLAAEYGESEPDREQLASPVPASVDPSPVLPFSAVFDPEILAFDQEDSVTDVEDPLAEFDYPSQIPAPQDPEDFDGADELPTAPLPALDGISTPLAATRTVPVLPVPGPPSGGPRPPVPTPSKQSTPVVAIETDFFDGAHEAEQRSQLQEELSTPVPTSEGALASVSESNELPTVALWNENEERQEEENDPVFEADVLDGIQAPSVRFIEPVFFSGAPPPPSSNPAYRPNPPIVSSLGEVAFGLPVSSRPPPRPPRPGGAVAADPMQPSEAPSFPIEIREVQPTQVDTFKDTPIPPPTSWAPAPPASVPGPPGSAIDSAPTGSPPDSGPIVTTEELMVSSSEDPFADLDNIHDIDQLEEFSSVPENSPAPVETSSEALSEETAAASSSDVALPVAPLLPSAERKPPPPRRTVKPALPKVKEPRKKPWWETLFGDDFSRAYRPMTPSQLVREVDFILSGLDVPPGAVILDLGCGQGEICVELARRGYSVVGYDLSVYQLAMAGDNAQAAGQKINFLQGDMREMAFDQMFDAVICWDTTFGYFEEDKNVEVLGRIKKALKPNGRLLLDVMNRDFAAREAPYNHWFEGDGCVCMDDMSLDWITNRLQVKRSIILDDGRSKELNFTTRLYTLSEVGRMLHDAGFRVAAVSGDVATRGAFFGPHSRRLIIQAGKP